MSLTGSLFRDVRFAGRLFVKDCWFTLMAVVVLALGIGANNAVFTIVNSVLLRSLPLPDAEQIMFVGTRDTEGRSVSLRDFQDWEESARTFSGLSFVFNGSFNVGNEGLIPDLVAGEASRERVAANGAAPPGAQPFPVTSALRRAPGGAVRGQDPPRCGNASGNWD